MGRSPDRGFAALSQSPEKPSLLSESLALDDDGLAALDSLTVSLAHLRGQAALILAFYDSPLLRDRLIAEIRARLPDLVLYTIEAHEAQPDLLPWLVTAVPPGAGVVCVTQVERVLPDTIAYLNYRREKLAALGCPVVMWFPARIESDLRRGAPDFWAFRRHTFVFRLYAPWVFQVSQKTTSDSLGAGDSETLQAGIATHRQLLADLGQDKTLLAATLHRNLGDLLLQAQAWPEARRELEQALSIFQTLGADDKEIAHTRLSLGKTLYYLDEREQAVAHYDVALALFQQVGDRLGEANVLQAQGDVLAFQKQNDEALGKYEAALALFKQVGDRLGEANVMRAQGDVLAFQDRRDEALGKYEAALALFKQVGDRLGEANVLLSQGDLLRGQEQFDRAWQVYENALTGYQSVGDAYSCARIYYRQGDWQAEQSHWPEAIELYQKAVAIWQSIGLSDLVEQIIQPRMDKAKENFNPSGS